MNFMMVIKFINTIDIRYTHTSSIGISWVTFFTQSSSLKTPSNALWSQGILETIEYMLITLVGWVLMCREGKSLQLCIWWSHIYFILTHPTIAKPLVSPILLIPKWDAYLWYFEVTKIQLISVSITKCCEPNSKLSKFFSRPNKKNIGGKHQIRPFET